MGRDTSVRAGVLLTPSQSLQSFCAQFGGQIDGVDEHVAAGITITHVAAAKHAGPGCLGVVFRAQAVGELRQASAVLVGPDHAAKVGGVVRWVHPHARWALAQVLLAFGGAEGQRGSADNGEIAEIDACYRHVDGAVISASARVHRGCNVGRGVFVGDGAVVLPGAFVDEGARIEPRAVIYGNTRIGKRVVIGAGAVIGRAGFGWAFGPDGAVVRMPQLGGVVIEDDVEVGPLCTVDSGTLHPTELRAGCKLDAQVHVGHNVIIGRGTIIAAQCGFAGSCEVGDRVLIGGKVGVADHVVIGNGAKIAGGSGVIGAVVSGAEVAGYPAVARVRWLRGMARVFARAGGAKGGSGGKGTAKQGGDEDSGY